MHVGLCVYRDGPAFRATAARLETSFVPQLERMPGFSGVLMVRFCQPDNGACGGVGLVAFRGGDQLTAAMREAVVWSHHHLPDLQAAIRPTELYPAEVLFARGSLV
jgi:hypothetical protein